MNMIMWRRLPPHDKLCCMNPCAYYLKEFANTIETMKNQGPHMKQEAKDHHQPIGARSPAQVPTTKYNQGLIKRRGHATRYLYTTSYQRQDIL